MRAKQRYLIPAFSLFFLAPLVGEFLLGNLPITWLWTLITMAPLYGGGALLIRETARRLSLGWPSIIVLGLAYAVIEEAFVTQSLFNPNYLGLSLLDYGYINSLGISAWWTVFVLSIHTVWSTAVPIALIESLTPKVSRTPWLRPVGLAITAVVFLGGCVMSFIFQYQQEPFMASSSQLLVSGVVFAALIVTALLFKRIKPTFGKEQEPPAPSMVGGAAFILGSTFMSLAIVFDALPAVLNTMGMIALLLLGSFLIWNWSAREGWSERHRLAVAGGLLLTYAWYGFVQVPSAGDTSPLLDTIGNGFFAVGAVVLLVFAYRQVAERDSVVTNPS